LEDSYKQKGQRKRLNQVLRSKGIKDEKVLNALLEVPRHAFFPKDFWEVAYEDKAFPIGYDQTISQPYTVAFQTQLLKVQPGQKVLEIGTGSGYQASILSHLGAEVYSIERVSELFERTSKRLSQLNYSVHCFLGDGSLGLPKFQPFDRILVTAGAGSLAESLKLQLAENGRLVVPIGDQSIQKMVLIEKSVENIYTRSEHGDFKFVPLLGKNGW
jgi:protein-L-isoaspartate(D-aspartate) O-methyltransferase